MADSPREGFLWASSHVARQTKGLNAKIEQNLMAKFGRADKPKKLHASISSSSKGPIFALGEQENCAARRKGHSILRSIASLK